MYRNRTLQSACGVKNIKKTKLYFSHAVLCAYLTNWHNHKILESGAASDALFETFVISEMIKPHYQNGQFPIFYYYRDGNKYFLPNRN
jgi:hypothetical protein